jgi:DNA-directed RNA polymerase specialized sigma24 family protein
MTSPRSWRRANYSPGDVRALIEEYANLTAKADTHRAGLRFLVQRADLSRALERLSLKHWEVVLLHGLLGMTQEATAETLRVSHQAVSKRFRHAMDEIIHYINGGDDTG